MNTKRLIFGILAVVMLVATSVSTITIDSEDNGVRKGHTIRKGSIGK
ncbi:Hypothetical protein I595_225 [Croceitalea dokdonensis DOKDO 023]|uniref:Uncharacterized protein n=1 Tax=Croceitalea dokdonensis DOKDO 023 TaxID=1300341 RepID=A0A0P7AN29_9FLAO|nr:hypothetical protein [Croceitalea dokdonensis]KPM33322.1 Hypothetical protein I595_225 [Croceitalea dokdonensis DOKDO 023]